MFHVFARSKSAAGTAGLTHKALGMGVFVAAGKVGIEEGGSAGVAVATATGAQAARSKKQRMYINIFFIGFSLDHAAKIDLLTISRHINFLRTSRHKREAYQTPRYDYYC